MAGGMVTSGDAAAMPRDDDARMPERPDLADRILDLTAADLRPRDVAALLEVSEAVVREHLGRLQERYAADDALSLVAAVRAAGLHPGLARLRHAVQRARA